MNLGDRHLSLQRLLGEFDHGISFADHRAFADAHEQAHPVGQDLAGGEATGVLRPGPREVGLVAVHLAGHAQRVADEIAAAEPPADGDGTVDRKAQVAVGSGSLPVWDFIAAAPDALRVVELDDSQGSLIDAVRESRSYLLAGPDT